MSGWWPWASASSPTRFVNSRASRKSLNLYSFSRWCSLSILQPPPNSFENRSSSCPFKGGTLPLQGTHSFSANVVINHSPLFSESLTHFSGRRECTPIALQNYRAPLFLFPARKALAYWPVQHSNPALHTHPRAIESLPADKPSLPGCNQR